MERPGNCRQAAGGGDPGGAGSDPRMASPHVSRRTRDGCPANHFGRGLSVVWEQAVAGADVVQPDRPAGVNRIRMHRLRGRVCTPERRVPDPSSGTAGNGSRRPARKLDSSSWGRPAIGWLSRAIEMAVSRLGELSPLVIHGPSGVGKTHLLEAACGRCRELHPEKSAVFLRRQSSSRPAFSRRCTVAACLASVAPAGQPISW